jgi:hypothetical protein
VLWKYFIKIFKITPWVELRFFIKNLDRFGSSRQEGSKDYDDLSIEEYLCYLPKIRI